nr:receptor-like protein 43 [Ziziphus jujuba var. spinosa]
MYFGRVVTDGLFPFLSFNTTTLYLSTNQFFEPIPGYIGEAMPLLSTLDILLSIGNLSKLIALFISNNKLSGQVPQFWENLPFLEFIDTSNNSLSGTIPRSIGSLSHLQYLSIPSNNFFGELPFVTNCSKMVNIDLSYNKFSGKLPVWIGIMSSLLILRLKANFFTGNIPSQLCSLSNLHILDISHNNVSGHIPHCIGNLSGMKSESISMKKVLSNNKLSGELPSSLKNYTSLASLDLGDKNFYGKLPSWIGETMPNILILHMRANFFTGDIPSTFCSLANLHILDLSYNSLSDHILDCIGNLSAMIFELVDFDTALVNGSLKIVHDLSNNNFSGEIPKELIRLVKLVALNLSMNYLTGLIPVDIGNLKSLETLDLSNNKLFGPIPLSMPSLTFLSHLNLSYNNLSGKILTANQFQTLDDPSIYQGNVGLCGKPLPTDCTGSIIDTPGEKEEEDGDVGDPVIEQLGFFISIFMGFLCGILGCL